MTRYTHKSLLGSAFICALAALCSSASAITVPIFVANPSFENPALANGGCCTVLTSWVTNPPGGSGNFNPTNAQYAGASSDPGPGGVPDGEIVAFSNGSDVSQVLTTNLAPGRRYDVTVHVGERADSANPNYRVLLRAGGAALGYYDNRSLNLPDTTPGAFTAMTATFVAPQGVPAGTPLEIVLQNPGGGGQPNFDLVSATQSIGAAVGIANPSFESPTLADGGFTGATNGWTDGDGGGTGAGIFRPTAARYPGGLSDGPNGAFSNGPVISQTLAEQLVANRRYTLQVDVGDRNDTSFPGYAIELRAGATVLASATQADVLPANGTYATATLEFTAPAGHPELGNNLQIVLASGGAQTMFDNVKLIKESTQPGVRLIPINNPSFEQDPLSDGGFIGTAPVGWTTLVGGSGAFNPTNGQYAGASGVDGPTNGVPDGQNVLFSNGGTVSQILEQTLTSEDFLLQVDVGNRLEAGGFTYAVQLFAGATLIGQENSLTPADGQFLTSSILVRGYEFPAALGQPLEIRLFTTGGQSNFDNVRLTALTVPEPATMTLLGLTGLALLRRRRDDSRA